MVCKPQSLGLGPPSEDFNNTQTAPPPPHSRLHGATNDMAKLTLSPNRALDFIAAVPGPWTATGPFVFGPRSSGVLSAEGFLSLILSSLAPQTPSGLCSPRSAHGQMDGREPGPRPHSPRSSGPYPCFLPCLCPTCLPRPSFSDSH